jgi:hypothetical protein
MDSDHALCRECQNVVRLDWERCYHCGATTPVPTAAGSTLLRSGLTIGGLVVLALAAVNAQTLWRAARQAPELVTREAAVASLPVPSGAALGPAAAYAVRPTREAGSPIALRTSSVSGGDVARASTDRARAANAGARLDQEATARAIAAAESAAAVDSLETRLRVAYPDDPSLELGGRTWRLMKARRAALALR